MWPFRGRKGKHRKTETGDLEQKLHDVTKEHERESWKVATKSQRLSSAADKLIASNRQALRDAAHGGR